jgi:hypothetical protein
LSSNKLNIRNFNTWLFPVLLLVVLAVYLYSLCPSVYLIDSGELATVSCTLGVAHPTGYPLYTLVSYLFAHLPGDSVRNLNFLSALFSIAAAAILFITARRITEDRCIPVAVTSLFAFAPTIWRTSITNEVYPLTGLFAVLAIYLLYRFNSERIIYLTMYVLGLALTNHIIFFALALPIIVYILVVYRPSFRIILIGILFFVFGLTLYYYIIARTLGGAEIAWGNAYNLQRLIWHVTGKQYQVWMFTLSPSEVFMNLLKGLHFLARDFLYVLTIPAIIGFCALYRADKKKFWLLFSILILNLAYTINYSIPDIESYYIPSLVVLVVTFAYGLKVFKRVLKPAVILPLACVIPMINYSACTLRANTFGIDFGRAHAEQLPDSSLLITTHWDVYSPLMYLRHIKDWRSDLVMIDKSLLRRTWYVKYIAQEYPELYNAVRSPMELYLEELHKFEYGLPYTPYVIQSRYIRLLESLVETKINKGVFLSTPWVDQDLNQVKPDYFRIPYGLVRRLTRDTTVVLFDFSKLKLAKPPFVNDSRLVNNLEIIRNMLTINVNYLMAIGRVQEAEKTRKLLESF